MDWGSVADRAGEGVDFMKFILVVLTFILFILCLQINIPNNPGQIPDSVNFYQNIHRVYLGIFLVAAAMIYFYINRRKPRPESAPKLSPHILLAILCAGFILRILIAVTIPGHPYDIQAFIQWSAAASKNLWGIYTDNMIPPYYTLTYPPVYLYVLGLIGTIARFFLISSHTLYIVMLKLPAIIADVATGYLLYRFSKQYVTQSFRLLIAGLYIFNPVTLFNSALWGQVDAFFTLFIITGLLLIHSNRLPWAAVLFTLAVLFKPQGVFVLPVLFWELWRRKKFSLFLWSGLAGLVTLVTVLLPFSTAGGPFWIVDQYIKTAKQFPMATVNAYNLYTLFGANFHYDSNNFLLFTYYTWGTIFILGLLGLGTYLYWKAGRRDRDQESAASDTTSNGLPFLNAMLLSVGIFVLATRMHERYLFPALTTGLFTFILYPDRRLLYLFGGLTVTHYLTISRIFFEAFHGNKYTTDWMVYLVAFVNVILLIYLIHISLDIIKRAVHAKGKPGIPKAGKAGAAR